MEPLVSVLAASYYRMLTATGSYRKYDEHYITNRAYRIDSNHILSMCSQSLESQPRATYEWRCMTLGLESLRKISVGCSTASLSSTEPNYRAEVTLLYSENRMLLYIYSIAWLLISSMLRWLGAGAVDIQKDRCHASGYLLTTTSYHLYNRNALTIR